MAELSLTEWDDFLSRSTNPHILQTSPWGQLKAEFGWKVIRAAVQDCGAQILIKRILPGVNFAYIPRGPIGSSDASLWTGIDTLCRAHQCAFLKVEPDGWENEEPSVIKKSLDSTTQFLHSPHSIQPVRTLVVDISGGDTQILGRMKQKTRYNISLAQKSDLIVKPYLELGEFYNLLQVTGNRDQFGIHSQSYYKKAFEHFHSRDLCQLLVAEYENEAIAALMVFRSGNRAWYFYGASSDLHRNKMPNYLLQWEAMLWAKSQGCSEYDLWGVPDADLDTLERNFTTRKDGLWGVYRFKRGFGGVLKRSPGTWDRIYNPLLYRLYSIWLKYRKIQG